MTDDTVRVEIEALKDQIAELKETLGKLANAAAQEGTETLDESKERFGKNVRDTLEELERKVDEALSRGSETLHELDEYVTRHPRSSLLTAFGLGVLVARILDSGPRH
jgi:ElaB/YqjD/DUF883 family membrane-anchored ribosome-binding protein